jgi:hypothetical protein
MAARFLGIGVGRIVLTGFAVVAGAALTLWLLAQSWGPEIAKIKPFGWWALGISALLSLLLAGGLSALMIISSRRGFDDGVADHSANPTEDT